MKRIHILHTNDLHSQFQQVPKLYSKLLQIESEVNKENEISLLFDIGDHMDRAVLETEGTEGAINRGILEAFQYDVVTFGNNELLTFLPEQIESLYQKASFSVVSTNVKRLDGRNTEWIQPSKILTREGIQIGILGVTVRFENYYRQMGWHLSEPLQAIQKEAKQLREQVDLLIVLSHVGLPFDQQLAEQVPEVDLILGGHTHHLLQAPEKIKNTWIAAAGVYGQYLGHVTIDWDQHLRKIIKVSGVCHPMDSESPNEKIQQLLSSYRKQAKQKLDQPIVTLTEPLDVSWSQESPLPNLLADSLLEWTGVNLALVNSGQLLNGLSSGLVTKQMIHQICPHPINPIIMELKGDQVRNILEESLLSSFSSKEIRGFGFRGKILGNVAVAGLQVRYDPKGVSGRKIHSIYQEHDQTPLMDEQVYRIATIDMFSFGVGYPRFQSGEIIKIFMPEFLRDLLYDQLKKPSAILSCKKKRFLPIH